jgi:hypothetical protein
MRNEKDCIPSSKYQIDRAIRKDITRRIKGKIRQQYLLCFMSVKFGFRIKYSLKTYWVFKINVRELELQAEKYPKAPFEILEFGFAGAAEPGLLFTNSSNVLK